MNLLQKILGWSEENKSENQPAQIDSLKNIMEQLKSFDEEHAYWLASLAFMMGRVAHCDLETSDDELNQMKKIVEDMGKVPSEQAQLVVEVAKRQNQLFGGTEGFIVAREFRKRPQEEKDSLMNCLFAIAAADESISSAEESEIRQISSELGYSHSEFTAFRSKFSEYRAVFKT